MKQGNNLYCVGRPTELGRIDVKGLKRCDELDVSQNVMKSVVLQKVAPIESVGESRVGIPWIFQKLNMRREENRREE